jgi:membrane protease YdiL (CAAX protease family)
MDPRVIIRRHPVAAYFALAYFIPAIGFFGVVGPQLIRGEPTRASDALILFPAMELAVFVAGIALTAIVDGRRGLQDLFSRMGRWRIGARWYATVLIPPALILAVLLSLGSLLSPSFFPRFFPFGILFGIIAGFFEETGWMGYAFPKMLGPHRAIATGVVLGLLWGLWHAPVIDGLGANTPHGAYWLSFFLAFAFAMSGMRVIIVWVYSNTKSVLLAQLIHATSTGFLVVLSPGLVTPGQEVLWYAVYGAALWIVVALVAATYGARLVRQPAVAGRREPDIVRMGSTHF